MSRSRRAAWLAAGTVYAAILAGSALPGDAVAGTPAWAAAAAHVLEYALLAASLRCALGREHRTAGFTVVLLTLVAGTVNEVQQGWVPGRMPDVADIGLDGLGALLGIAALRMVTPRAVRTGVSARRGRGPRPPGPGSAARRRHGRPRRARRRR